MRFAVAALAAATTLSCVPADRPTWRDQVVADSPCLHVNLRDGLDESGPQETNDLFACLDRWDHLESLHATWQAAQRPANAPASVDLARAANALPDAGVAPFDLLDVAVSLLRAPDDPLSDALDVSLELITGTPAPFVRAGSINPNDPQVLASGVIAPLLPAITDTAAALLRDNLVAVDDLGDALAHEDARRLVRTLDAVARSRDPSLAPAHALAGDLGDLLLQASAPSPPAVWPSTSGDRARDLVDTLVVGTATSSAIERVQRPAWRILSDPALRASLPEVIARLDRTGVFANLPDELGWLASVNARGEPLSRGEASGVEAMLRLLHGTHREMVCTLNLGLVSIDVSLGDLAVTLLNTLADVDPSTVQTGAGVFGTVVGWPLSQGALGLIAASGTCPALTPTVVQDLAAVDLLFDDRADHLVIAFMALLSDLKRQDEVDDFVAIAAGLWASRTGWALGELLRATSDAPLWADAVSLVPVVLSPTSAGLPADSADLLDAWDAAEALLRPRADGTRWSHLSPALAAALGPDETWDAVNAAAWLLSDPTSSLSGALDLVPAWVDADPDLVLLDTAAALLGDRAVAAPLLRVAANEDVVTNLLATSPPPGQEQVPLAFGARLITGGALDDLLALFDLVIRELE